MAIMKNRKLSQCQRVTYSIDFAVGQQPVGSEKETHTQKAPATPKIQNEKRRKPQNRRISKGDADIIITTGQFMYSTCPHSDYPPQLTVFTYNSKATKPAVCNHRLK